MNQLINASLRFNGHFPREPGYPVLLKLRMMEVVVTTEAISRAKLQSNHHHQQTNTQLFTGWMTSCCSINSVKAFKGKISHFADCQGSSNFVFDH